MSNQKVLLMDNFAAHSSGDATKPLENNGVFVEFLPFNNYISPTTTGSQHK